MNQQRLKRATTEKLLILKDSFERELVEDHPNCNREYCDFCVFYIKEGVSDCDLKGLYAYNRQKLKQLLRLGIKRIEKELEND